MTDKHGMYYIEIPGQIGENEDFTTLELTESEAEAEAKIVRPEYHPVNVRLLRTLECDLPFDNPNAQPFESQRYAVVITLPEQERLRRKQEEEDQAAKNSRQQAWFEKMRQESYAPISWEQLSHLPVGILIKYRLKPHRSSQEPWSTWREAIVHSVLQGDSGPRRWATPFPSSALVGLGLGKDEMEQGFLEVEAPQSLEPQPE